MKRFTIILICCAVAICALADEDEVVSSLSFRRFTTQDGLPQMQTEAVWQDQQGYIYIGTLSGFVRYDGRSFTPLLRGRRENIVAFRQVDDQVRALGFRRQWLVDGQRTTAHPIDAEGQWLLNNLNATDLPEDMVLLEDEQEEHRRLCRITTDSFPIISENPLLDAMTPDRKLFVDKRDIYVPTPQGLYRISGSRERLITKHPDIYALLRQGSTLYAFAADGIYRVAQDTIAPVVAYMFEAPDYGFMARPAASGEIFIVDAHAIYVFDGHAVHDVAKGFNLIRSLFIDKWDRLWIGSYQGVYSFFRRYFTNHRLSDKNDIVRALGVTGGKHLVCGTLNGKLLFDGKVVSNQPDNYYIPSSAVVDDKVYMASRNDVACIDSSGTVTWLHLPFDRYRFVAAAGHRLVFASRQTVMSYDPASGQTDTLSAYIRQPWCAATDDSGRLYVGSSGGVHCITQDVGGGYRTTRIDDKEQFFVTTMAADRQGHVYLAAADSVFVIRDGQITYLPLAGLSGHEVRSLHVSSDDVLLVATIDALFAVRPDSPSPTLHSFDHLTGFSMIEPQQAVMAEMADGTVWMAGLEEMSSFRPAELLTDNRSDTFVAPPLAWWQRWWVIALAALALAGLFYLLIRLIVRSRLRRLERDRRQKELQISAIRLKAIPHFHSNVLAGIEYFLMNDSTDEATRYLKLYSDFTNLTLTDIDRASRNVNEEVEYARIYLQLEQLRYGTRLTYDISVSGDIPVEAQIPNMVIYTYAQNAVKHGIAPKPEGGHIDIRIRQQNNQILVEVEDNGIGREAAARLSQHSTKQGLRILMEQVALYNRRNRRPITQRITDLHDADGHATGTRFTMSVPLNFRFSV